MTGSITIRLSEKERQELRKYGTISEVAREALRLYLRTKKSRDMISRLKELQKASKSRTTIREDLRLIRMDRQR